MLELLKIGYKGKEVIIDMIKYGKTDERIT